MLSKPILWSMIICGATILIVTAIKLGYFNRQVLTAFLVISLSTLLCLALLYLSGYFDKKDDDRKDTAYYFRRINELLLARPEGDAIDWTGGQDVRTFLKRYKDDRSQEHEFFGVVGRSVTYKKMIAVIYNINRDDLEIYYGDPSANVIMNPFKDFDPFNRIKSQEMNNLYNKSGQKPDSKVSIHMNNRIDEDNSPKSLAERASSAMRDAEHG